MRESKQVVLHAVDAEATRAVGAALARATSAIDAPVVVSLEGELGAGKTTLVGGFLNALGYRGHARSPTYTLIEPYELMDRSVYHLDLYRLNDPREMEALGLRDLLHPHCLFLIEWPDRAADALPPLDIAVALQYESEGGRQIVVRAVSEVGSRALRSLHDVTKP